MLGSSINLPVITHECNYSHKKSTHLFSIDHQCKNAKCLVPQKVSKEAQVSKIPCCQIETNFVQNQDFTPSARNLSPSQAIILSTIFSFILPITATEVNTKLPLEPEPKHFGLQYRIELQSFLC